MTCFIDDAFGLQNLQAVGEDMVAYESDYPHSDSLWPKAPETLWDSVKHLTEAQIDKVTYDSKLDVVRHALGLHTSISRVQGGKLKAKKEIRIASLFREAAPEFLKMIVVHELAHLKESDHNKAFYRLCEFMQPGYHQIEFDLRLYLTHRDLTKNQT